MTTDGAAWRSSVVTMAAVLGSWLTAWPLEAVAGVGPSAVVLAVVMALTLSRATARPGTHAMPGWARIVALPVIAVVAAKVGLLMRDHPTWGDAAFVVAVSGAVWLRRYGARWSALGTLVALPFVALLAVPVIAVDNTAETAASTLWPAAFGLIALAWVSLTRVLARQAGWLEPVPAGGNMSPRRSAVSARRMPASSRMAAQLAIGLGLSFATGRWLFPEHWSWVVMSCYVVCSGNRGRGDVVHKGVLRLGGALVGTASATLLAGLVPEGDRWALVLLFAVMAVAVWARELSYAYWAAGVTALLALLYGYYGYSGVEELGERLLGVFLGAMIAVLVSWFVLPVRSRDVFRRRWADGLAALSDYLRAAREEPAAAVERWRGFDHAVRALRDVEPAYRLHRRTLHREATPHPADLVAGLVEVRDALAALDVGESDERERALLGAWARRTGDMRRRMRADGSDVASGPPATLRDDDAWARTTRALEDLDAVFTRALWQRLGGR